MVQSIFMGLFEHVFFWLRFEHVGVSNQVETEIDAMEEKESFRSMIGPDLLSDRAKGLIVKVLAPHSRFALYMRVCGCAYSLGGMLLQFQ